MQKICINNGLQSMATMLVYTYTTKIKSQNKEGEKI